MNIGDRLLSRKWWLVVAACCFLASQGPVAFDNLAQIVIAYLTANTAAEAFSNYVASRTTATPTETPMPSSPEITDGEDEGAGEWTGSTF